MIKEWVDKQYEEGRVTVLTDDELVVEIDGTAARSWRISNYNK